MMREGSGIRSGSDSELRLSADERAELIRLAREAIGSSLGLVDSPELRLRTAKLLESSGAFVTLHLDGELRGCIGTLEAPAEPLYETVMQTARAAAFKDPRFAPLRADEWPRIVLEISQLTPPRRAAPEEVVAGLHGVHVSRGPARALLLPQVARERAWDRERLLREVCHKAGLDENAWQDRETELSIFTADVFSSGGSESSLT